MKKSFLSAATILALTVALVGCGPTSEPTDPTTSEPTASEPTSQPTTEPVPSDPFEGLVEGAVAQLKSDLTVKSTVTVKRDFISPFYSDNNFLRIFAVDSTYGVAYEGKFVVSETELFTVTETEQTSSGKARTVYDKATYVRYDEVVDHTNTPYLLKSVNASGNYEVVGAATLGYNHFKDIEVEDLTLSEDGTQVAYVGTAFSSYISNVFGPAPVTTSANISIVDGKFSSFEVTFETLRDMYISTQGEGAEYYQTYTLEGEFFYDAVTFEEAAPVEGDKVAELDAVLSKFVDTSYVVQPINPDLKEDGASVQVIYSGDQIAIDMYDLFSDDLAIGTLSWMDSKLVKNEETGKYYIENLALNEDTYEFEWLSTEEVVGSVTDKYIEDAISFDEGRFDLDFVNIDTSLFTLKDEANKIYTLNPRAAKQFGKCVVPTITDYSAVLANTGMHMSQYATNAASWTVQIVDETTLYFECTTLYDFGGAAARGSWGFIVTNPGFDIAPFYSDELPSLF